MDGTILTINTGSSSLKAAVYDADAEPKRRASLDITQIPGDAKVVERGEYSSERTQSVAGHREALDAMAGWLRGRGYDQHLLAAGHRVVHGGPTYSEPAIVSQHLIRTLQSLVPIDPMHLPQAIAAMEEMERIYPDLVQVACFDTAFHRTMPEVAQTYAVPADIRTDGVMRYGFHGLSYEYIVGRMRTVAPQEAAGRMVIAHLGNGASMAAVESGRGADTTMGLTPTGGLVMGTRTGDLDPGVLLYLLQQKGMAVEELNMLLNSRSGLLGLSGSTSDMQDLLHRRATDPAAALAVDVFCYTARKYVGALAAALGGLDALIFTGGIGEHAADVRSDICTGLDSIGIRLSPEKNAAGAAVISAEESRVMVRVMATDEDAMIAAHTLKVLSTRGDARVSV